MVEQSTEDQTSEPAKKPPDDYRQWLIASAQKAQDSFDKAVLSLSGGALGVSFVFVKDFIGTGAIHSPKLLLAAWLCWGFSSLAILGSFYTSNLALGKAIEQCDDGTVYSQTPNNTYAHITKSLNAAGALLFCLGVCLMAAFIYVNLATREYQNDNQETYHTTPAPAPAPAPTNTTASP